MTPATDPQPEVQQVLSVVQSDIEIATDILSGIRGYRVKIYASHAICQLIAACRINSHEAGRVEGVREGVDYAAEKMCDAIASGYPTPTDKHDQCQHGQFGWEDCIACYDEALLAAIRALSKEPTK